MCLFLKPKFGNRKKATGRDGDFHAVFCGQFSISLHSSVQNWSLLLWWLYFLAMEVLDGQSQIITCFWLLSNFFWLLFFFFLFVGNVPWCESCQVVILSVCHHMQTPKCVCLGELPVALVMGWGLMKRQRLTCCKRRMLSLVAQQKDLVLPLGTKWLSGWYTYQKRAEPRQPGCKEKCQVKVAFGSLVNDQLMLVNGAWSLCTESMSIMLWVETWVYCITARSLSIWSTFEV